MEQIISDAIGYVHQVFRNDFSGHDAYHSIRVYKTAVEIAAEEGADATLVALAALLHDVDDRKLSPETAAGKNRAVQFLQRKSVPPELISAICTVIDQVSYRGTDSVVPSTLEGKCVQDADRLDALGAIGIARTFAYGGSHSRPLYDPEEKPRSQMGAAEYYRRTASSVNHFYEKLLLLKDMMNTETGRRVAQERTALMQRFLDAFFAEWDGLDIRPTETEDSHEHKLF